MAVANRPTTITPLITGLTASILTPIIRPTHTGGMSHSIPIMGVIPSTPIMGDTTVITIITIPIPATPIATIGTATCIKIDSVHKVNAASVRPVHRRSAHVALQ